MGSPTNANNIVYYAMILFMSSFRWPVIKCGTVGEGKEENNSLKLVRECQGMSGNLKK